MTSKQREKKRERERERDRERARERGGECGQHAKESKPGNWRKKKKRTIHVGDRQDRMTKQRHFCSLLSNDYSAWLQHTGNPALGHCHVWHNLKCRGNSWWGQRGTKGKCICVQPTTFQTLFGCQACDECEAMVWSLKHSDSHKEITRYEASSPGRVFPGTGTYKPSASLTSMYDVFPTRLIKVDTWKAQSCCS